MSKQDRVYTRTAADLERKYKLGTPSNGGGDSQEISKLSQLLSQFMASVNQKISAIETKLKNIGKPSAEDVSYTSSSLSATNVQDAIDELEEELEQKGDGGIYIGSGEMPEDCNVQIDPSGEIEEYVLKSEYDAKVAVIDSAISEQNKKMGSLIKRETLTKTPDAKGNMLLKSNNIIPLFIIVTSVKNEVFLHKFASYNGYPYARLYDSNNNVITTQITFDLYYLEL